MRLYAIILAAGHSRRMGRPKLLLPLGGRTVMARLLAALDVPAVCVRAVVLRASDEALRREVESCGGVAVCPATDPPDMRASLEAGLAWIREAHQPTSDDAWLLVPGDHPVLDRAVIAELTAAFAAQRPRFLIPTFQGRRGHPLIARWDAVDDVFQLPPDVGLNHLLRERTAEVCEHAVDSPAVLCDLDTPEDYDRLVQREAQG